VIEPIIQGAAGMKVWPSGTLRALRGWCDSAGTLLIADEVMTGFGRTAECLPANTRRFIPIFTFSASSDRRLFAIGTYVSLG
jgi:adenosylmethionine-8-amino-7-oxononanoate aminotransferase